MKTRPLIAVSILAVLLAAASAGTPDRRTPAPPAKDANLIWHDEFDGKALDPTKWIYRGLGPRKGGVNVKDAVTLDGKGHLAITTRRVGDKFHTGMIATQGKHEWTYGYFECRVKFQRSIGHWSAFWLQSPRLGKTLGDTKASGTEIDIFEYLRRRPNEMLHNLHWDGYGKHHKHHGSRKTIQGLGDRWHTVGLEWTTGRYVFYVDGKETWRTDKAVSGTPQYIILSAEVGKWAGDIRKAKLPDSVQFDYVRVYKTRPKAATK